MNLDICDKCGDVIAKGTGGAKLKVYDKNKIENQRGNYMWGIDLLFCDRCYTGLFDSLKHKHGYERG